MSEPGVQLYAVADYLAFEQYSDIRHEYLAGTIHAMAGESKAHNAIVGSAKWHPCLSEPSTMQGWVWLPLRRCIHAGGVARGN